MGRPILIFRDRACPFTAEDVELLRDNLPSSEELLKKKLDRTVTTIETATIDPADYRGLLAAIQSIRRSGVSLSIDLIWFEDDLEAEVGKGTGS